MDGELKAKWVAALRSGEYEQGHGYLLKDGKYCCMGVLCKVKGLAEEDISNNKGYHEVTEELGGHDVVTTVWRLNDGVSPTFVSVPKLTFSQIADYIEAHL